MPDYTLRFYEPRDRDGCAALWEHVFGDPAALVERFLSLFQAQTGFCLLAESDGAIAAAAYSIPGLRILRPGQPELPARYLYAVATHPAHRKRGLAADLCRALRDQAFARNELLLTKPAEPSLYPWYAEKIGAVPAMPCQKMTVNTPAPGEVRPLTPAQYAARREAILRDRPHVHLPRELFIWESLLHAHYGGGFFAVGDAIADVYIGDTLELPELLSPGPETTAGALLRHFSRSGATATLPGGTDPYISCAAPPDDLSAVWFGPVFG